MKKRSQRRADENRMLQRAIQIIKSRDQVGRLTPTQPIDNEQIKKRARKMRDHLAECSCWMCGNPRNQKIKGKDKKTIQERKNQ